MKPFTISGVPSAVSAAGLASAVTYSGGGYALSANDAGDSLAHKITITGKAVTNHSGKTFTVTGTGPDGQPLTEAIAGPNGAVAVTTTKYFATVTSVTVDATTGADGFDIGWAVDAVTPWHYLSDHRPGENFNLGFACIVDSGSPTFSVEETFDGGVTAFAHSTVSAKSASIRGSNTTPVQALRLNWTAVGGVTLHGYQV